MNPSLHSESPLDPLSDTVRRAGSAANDRYDSAARKAGDTLATTKEYVRRNPVPVVLGAVAVGAALGYLLVTSRRKPAFRGRFVDEPLIAAREAILGAFGPVAQRVHGGYESAREGAGRAMDRVHGFDPRRAGDSLSEQLGRIGHHLKFW
jgi:hypothetical protein